VQRRRGEAVFIVWLLGAAVALLWTCRTYAPPFIRQWFVSLPFATSLDFVWLLAAAFCALIVHEMGHLLAALGFEFHFLGASVGPVNIQTMHGEWKISFVPRRIFSGSISAIPCTMEQWRGEMLIVIAAGPIFTLVAALLVASVGMSGQVFQIAFVQLSMLLFILGLIPNSQGSRRRNDARLFLDLAMHKHGAEEMEIYISLSQLVVKGVRPQDYPEILVAKMAAWRGRPESEYVFSQALVRWALDSDKVAVADECDLRALALAERCDSRIQDTALASSACFDVLFRDDLESARNKFERVDWSTLFPKSFAHRSRAAHQIALGRLYRAPAEIIRAQYALPRGIEACALDRAMLERLHMRVLLAPNPGTGGKFKTASA
jgi:hypothetical protein